MVDPWAPAGTTARILCVRDAARAAVGLASRSRRDSTAPSLVPINANVRR
jgi:hypothetical protein